MTALDRHAAYTLFCEDYRPELGGKFSAIGIYPAELGISEDTRTFPKFVIITVASLTVHQFRAGLEVSLWDRETLLAKSPFSAASPPDEDEVERVVVQIPIEACPFDAVAGMELRMQLEGPGFSYASAPLRIRKLNEVDQGTNFGPLTMEKL
jgi:hypothetical protein